jgi:plastocyanin
MDNSMNMNTNDNNNQETPPQMKHSRNLTPKKVLGLGLCLVAVLLIGAIISNMTTKTSNKPTASKVSSQPPVATVDLSDTGFFPATVSIKKGTIVEWTAKDDKTVHIVASNPYPNDDALSGLKSQQFGNGAKYSYQFNQTGTFNYHDDLHPELNGVVVVE